MSSHQKIMIISILCMSSSAMAGVIISKTRIHNELPDKNQTMIFSQTQVPEISIQVTEGDDKNNKYCRKALYLKNPKTVSILMLDPPPALKSIIIKKTGNL